MAHHSRLLRLVHRLADRLVQAHRSLTRPPAPVIEGVVFCGHCGATDVFYVETVGHYARFGGGADGQVLVDTGTFSVDDEGTDPRVECLGCHRVSTCPDFDWL